MDLADAASQQAVALPPLGKGQQLAYEAASSGQNLFISGMGGVGKTEVVGRIVSTLRGRGKTVAVTASTGMAGVSIGGATIHSFLGTGIARTWADAAKVIGSNWYDMAVDRMESTDTLIIDEVSMLTGDYISMMDRWMRLVRNVEDRPFGGVQVIFVGDFLQLPPVVRRDETPPTDLYAFESPAWAGANLTDVILGKSFRQESAELITMLRKVRIGAVDSDVLEYFNQCVGRKLTDPTRLYSTNRDADHVNRERLAKLPGQSFNYRAKFTGMESCFEQLADQCVAEADLELRVGAPVIFLKNNWDVGFANGDRGRVQALTPTNIYVELMRPGLTVTIDVPVAEWKLLNGDGAAKATLEQFPIKLAWALTIHKSQGMTLPLVACDLGGCFEKGQAYVALSRARTLEGLSLIRPIRKTDIKTSKPAVDFYKALARARKQE